jgi:NAD(P)-dependent dehydrogenase (short-subunit alcohol dehydrogenase family)
MNEDMNNFLARLYSLEGKTALVTGGATGIGRMIATALVHAGARVLIASRKGVDCEKVAAELNALGAAGSAIGFGGDVSSEAGVNALTAEALARTDKLHMLFNNSGVSWGAPKESFPWTAWEKVMSINVFGLFTLSRNLLPLLENSSSAADPARIINLGSVMGITPMTDPTYSYSTSKAAVHHLTAILANELAGKHVTVNAFAPGPFQSKMTAFATGSEEKAAAVGKNVPLGRIGSPDDIAAATLFLCGHGGSYITGQILNLDGGIHVNYKGGLFGEL